VGHAGQIGLAVIDLEDEWILAILLKPIVAGEAVATTVHHAADSDDVVGFNLRDGIADRGCAADNLMSRNRRELDPGRFASCRV